MKPLSVFLLFVLSVVIDIDKQAVRFSFAASDSPQKLRLTELEQMESLRKASQERTRRQRVIEDHNQLHVAIPLGVINEKRVIIFERDTSSALERPDSGMQPLLRLDIQILSQRRLTLLWSERGSRTEFHKLERDQPTSRFEISPLALKSECSSDRNLKMRCSARMVYRQIDDYSHCSKREKTVNVSDFWTSNLDNFSRPLNYSTDFEMTTFSMQI